MTLNSKEENSLRLLSGFRPRIQPLITLEMLACVQKEVFVFTRKKPKTTVEGQHPDQRLAQLLESTVSGVRSGLDVYCDGNYYRSSWRDIAAVLYINSSSKSQQSSRAGALVKSVVSLVLASLYSTVPGRRSTLNCLSWTPKYFFTSFHTSCMFLGNEAKGVQ